MRITLCGSARLEGHFHLWNKILSLSKHVVFGLSCYPSIEGEKDWYSDEQKAILDEVHQHKIRVSDAILVLNYNAYIGESTLEEISHAREKEKVIYFLESWSEGIGPDKYSPSPIDTYKDNFWWNLLPPTSELRCNLVDMIHNYNDTLKKEDE